VDGIRYRVIRAKRPDGRGVPVRKLIPETGNGHEVVASPVTPKLGNSFILKGMKG
jgi:hypothetical protein